MRFCLVTSVLNSDLQAAVSEYGVFWELWPQFMTIAGERQPVGFEVELMGSHTADPTHLDPACPLCCAVRSVLLAIANVVVQETVFRSRALSYDIDSHTNSITCSPALGNRPLVSVSINVSLPEAHRRIDPDIMDDIKACLAQWGIHEH